MKRDLLPDVMSSGIEQCGEITIRTDVEWFLLCAINLFKRDDKARIYLSAI